ncbi:MAG: hypothetical protein GTO55_07345 [Armatimonadetes bacterium]|nr:hypothetical protein [Armatimonadota bacterium]NIM24086.1 hypothetical protein [Armatimonadota bacterium]NIM67940.1 hypothetical protein [Armatimonadota bacterium]NIM76462.1 hypothetical protein [Armatimonadota bacterium]NIN06170.1 hypothetical protein [Armatimonadota bacterium]
MEVKEKGSLEAVPRIAVAVAVFASLAALPWGPKAAGGVAAGAGLGIASLLLLQSLVSRACKAKRPKRWLWALWVVKFPILCTLLYFLIGREWVSPVGFCVGVGVVPLVLVVSGLWPKREEA